MFKKLICFFIFVFLPFFAIAQGDHQKFEIELREFPPGGGFTLDCGLGKCSLDDYRGKIVILFFGYVSCPDICPTTLQQIQSALALLDADELSRVQIVFVSLDPLRDSPKVLADYLSFFKLPATGLTGKVEDIDLVVEQYAGQYKKVPYPGSALGYGIDHSAALYLIDGAGKLRSILRHQTPPDFLALSLKNLLGER
jgi:protein SCO1/2